MNLLQSAPDMAIVEKTWFNALWFQTTWFSCVLGREDWLPLTLLLMGFHYFAVSDLKREIDRVWPCALLGIAVDLALTLGGIFDFGTRVFPLWMVCLWFVFPAALPRALSFLASKPYLPFLLGTFAPINYLAGERLGAVTLPLGYPITITLLVPIWAFLLPVLVRLCNRRESSPA